LSVWIAGGLAVLIVAGAASAEAAIKFDASRNQESLNGISVGGVAIGGLRFDAARSKILNKFEQPLDRTFTFEASGKTFSATPRRLGISNDARSIFTKAVALNHRIPALRRAWYRITGASLGRRFKITDRVDESKVSAFVDEIASQVDKPAKDAYVSLTPTGINIGSEVPGYQLDKAAAVRQIGNSLKSGGPAQEDALKIQGKTLVPTVAKASIKNVLVLHIGENKLYHFSGESLEKVYDVATGSSEHPTPTGQFRIINKQYKPDWVNPAKYPGGWGANLPARIPPGPGNPLGTRAMNINAPAIFIHGTYSENSMGYNASHGCIRMRIAEAEQLYDLVPVGTPVIITQTGPYRTMPSAPSAPTIESLAEGAGAVPAAIPAPPAASPGAAPAANPTAPPGPPGLAGASPTPVPGLPPEAASPRP